MDKERNNSEIQGGKTISKIKERKKIWMKNVFTDTIQGSCKSGGSATSCKVVVNVVLIQTALLWDIIVI